MLQLNYSNGVQEALTPVVNANGNATGVLAPPAGEDYWSKDRCIPSLIMDRPPAPGAGSM